MTEVTPNLPHFGSFCKYCFMGTLLQEPPSVLLSATRLLYHMGNIFRDNAPAPAATGVQIDRKRLARLRQKRVALGHKPDDHELEQQQGFSMKFHM